MMMTVLTTELVGPTSVLIPAEITLVAKMPFVILDLIDLCAAAQADGQESL